MDGKDMQRRVGEARKAKLPRQTSEALRRNQGPIAGATAEDCLEAGRDPERRLEPLRRAQGSTGAAAN